MSARQMEMSFPRTFAALESIFDFIQECFVTLGVAPDQQNEFDLIAEELFTNMVKYNLDGKHNIVISLERRGDAVKMCLVDRDVRPFDVTKVPDPDLELPLVARRPGGLGLYLVRQMADSLDYEHVGGTSRITATKSVRTPQEKT